MEFVKGVRFGFYSDEELKKMGPQKITNPIFLDGVDRPLLDGLYDPKLGPLDEHDYCKSCGQSAFHCPGHCGHIDIVSPVYNPLLFDMLYHLLQRICFSCGRFRVGAALVEKCAAQLELILNGDIVAAKNIETGLYGESSCLDYTDGAKCESSEHLKQQGWTNLQFTEAMSVLHNFFKPKCKKCRVCKFENPKITKPTFGWLCTDNMRGARIRANVIRESEMKISFTDNCTADNPASDSNDVDDVFPSGEAIDTETHLFKEATADQIRKAPAEFIKQFKTFSGPLLPSDVRTLIKNLWENEARLCSFISDINQARVSSSGSEAGFSMFFLDTIVVPPIKFRPPAKAGDSVTEHPQTVLLEKVLQANISLRNAKVKNLGNSAIARQWMYLQQSVNVLFDSKMATSQGQGNFPSGICQLLEKKEGIFRQKMMGKRVNHACRSVISPDPYLAVNEIGIPPYFALKLTYPERVTPWNVVKLREAIINGPDIHPGATHYMDKLFNVRKLQEGKNRISISRKLPSSGGVVTLPGKNCDYDFQGKIVYRHLQDGDIVLVNRQPTLHKPSIMAHVVRVLQGEKTIRMHYSNCSAYNADFDGDEMNVHFPQDEISRAEAYNIVNANNQYIVPTRGDAKRGLIQDNIVSAVLLTMKDTFFTREEYNHLLYSSGVSSSGLCSFPVTLGQKVSVVENEIEMQPLLPAVWKPKPLWTGKQVITAILNHITRGHAPFSVKISGKIPQEYFGSKSGTQRMSMKNMPSESTLLIYKNELVHGLIDQAQFGNYGLVHTVQELYGSNTAGVLLSVLSRLFTVFMQMHGFTCGVDDLLILHSRDVERKKKLEGAENIGEQVHREFLKLKDHKADPLKLQEKTEENIRSKGEPAIAVLDRLMSNKLGETFDMNAELLREGLWKPFPKNCISLMTVSGAKGSLTNFSEISSFLGQQTLEGKRVPRMNSGKTLPCFPPWDCASRAGGFISDCFLSGLRPQEYYFHCMAGREGLVDTAVKTSRSGYLQRCLIKNLESLKVCYDYTVRDADGSIVQFAYGEDGIDVHQINFLQEHGALLANKDIFHEKFGLKSGDAQKSEIDRDIEKLPFVSSLSKDMRKHFKMTSRELKKSIPGDNKGVIFNLMKHKYLSSLAHPGEPVGVIAAQSIGEPSTQMTLNTFHFAGRGEMNVTLGIPRLQEILMTASSEIKTPIMSCPLLKGKTEEDGKGLAAKLKRVTVADIVEHIEVSFGPVTLHGGQISSIYKLKMKLYEREHCFEYLDMSTEDVKTTLEVIFIRALEDAIQNHMVSHARISGIKNFVSDSRTSSSADAGEVSDSKLQGEGKDDDNDDDNAEEEVGDIGSSADKIKQQGRDEIDYEGSDDELNAGSTKGVNPVEDESGISEGGENLSDVEGAESGGPTVVETVSELKKTKPKSKEKIFSKKKSAKETDRAIFVAVEGLHFEAHFRFTNEPCSLLAQVAQRVAKRVYIINSGKINRCDVVKCSSDKVLDASDDSDEWVLQAAGVEFPLFWQMQDVLDVRRLYTNDVHAMLHTYGVEAARHTIIREIQTSLYRVKVDVRHLTLVADYMTHSGGFRSMSRSGAIAGSVSPFSKMTFEQASKFIVEAAQYGLTDDLESPSSRICLGLPVKMGTGCFDILQKVDV